MPWSATVRDREFKFCTDSHRPTVFLSRGSCVISLAKKEKERENQKPNKRDRKPHEINFYRYITAFVRMNAVKGLFFFINVNISLVTHLCVERIV